MEPLYWVLLALLVMQRLLEMALSGRHEGRLKEQGGREHAPGQFHLMALLHSLWFAAIPLEVILLRRPYIPALAAGAAMALLAGQALRYAAIRTLGERWTVRVVSVPERPLVADGIYRYVRHPNYLGVILEIAAIPLMHAAWITAAGFGLANLLLLAWRIRTEEQALGERGNPLISTNEH